MTFGVTNVINCINQSAIRTDLTALELLQLTGSDCQFDKCAVFSAACQASLPTASCNTGRFVYITSECKYYFSNGSIWTDDVDSQLGSSIYGWGCNTYGRLGDNSVTIRSSPVSVVGGFTNWCQVSAGRTHSLAVRTNGTAWAWGNNCYGRLGDNTTVNKSSPVSVIGGFTDWSQVSAGQVHSLGVRQNGTAWAWGSNAVGQLGDSTIVSKSSPITVVGGFTDWCQISARGTNSGLSLAVRTNGTAWAWGSNSVGQLGNNTGYGTNRSSPVSVVGGFTDWCQVSAGYQHSLGVRTNGTAWGWGDGTCGRLGDNSFTCKSSPVSVVGGFTDWCQIAAGKNHSLAVRQNGTAWAWGSGSAGKLGDNTAVNKLSPVSVIGGFTDWCQISAGDEHSVAIRTNGTAWGWGSDVRGQLGDNTTVNRSSPVSVVGGFCDWYAISAGSYQTLAIRKIFGF
jgi:alpha-tubulin suppressor-like RCC1 family protein